MNKQPKHFLGVLDIGEFKLLLLAPQTQVIYRDINSFALGLRTNTHLYSLPNADLDHLRPFRIPVPVPEIIEVPYDVLMRLIIKEILINIEESQYDQVHSKRRISLL